VKQILAALESGEAEHAQAMSAPVAMSEYLT